MLNKASIIIDDENETEVDYTKLIFTTEIGKRFNNDSYNTSFQCKMLDFLNTFYKASATFPNKYHKYINVISNDIDNILYYFEESNHTKSSEICSRLFSSINKVYMDLAICESLKLFKKKEPNESGGYNYIEDNKYLYLLIDKLNSISNMVGGRIKNIRKDLKSNG